MHEDSRRWGWQRRREKPAFPFWLPWIRALIHPFNRKLELKASEVLALAQLVANGDIRELFERENGNKALTIKDIRDLGHTEQRLIT